MADDIKFVIGVDDRDLIKAQKEQIKFQRNIITIEKAFRNGDITTKRYNQELNRQTKELQRLGGSYRTASSEVRKYAYAMRQADDATLAQSQAMAFAGKKINRMGVGLQQAGYQIGDFAVQIQGGTNAMVALGQQGSQLLGIFGPYGALAGAALAIGTAFIAPFMRATKEVKAFQRAADEALQSVKDRVDELQTGRDKNVRGYDEEIARLRTLALEHLDVYNAKLATAKAQKLSNSDAEVFSRQERDNYHATLDLIRKQMKDKDTYLGYVDKERQLLKQKAQEEKDALEQIRKQEELARQERLLGQQMADLERQRALAQFKKDVAAEAETLEAMFQNRTLYYSIRFSGDSDVMSQSLEPSGKMKPTQSYEQLMGMGWSAEDLERIGMKPPRKSKSGGGSKKDPEEYINNLIAEAKYKKSIVGLSEEQARKEEILFNLKQQGDTATEEQINSIVALEANTRRLIEEQESYARIQETVRSTFEQAAMTFVDGTSSIKDAFKGLLRDMILAIYQEKVAKNFASTVLGMFGFANGGAFSGGSQIQAYADGGVVNSPSYFPMSGGKTGLMGEAGPEAIMPLKRGANGKLGVQMEGGGGDVVINQSFNFTANGDASVKNIIQQQMPRITEATKAAVVDAKRRGGSYGGAFS